MATFIDGIAASENIDSSGERIIIAGLDCSSLEKDGVFNYEHKNDQPNQVVGKILKARKIFSDKDCEDDRQLYFYKKCGVPFLYVMGELFDDYKDSARDIAGMFRYDADKKGQNERNVMNFSIEGAKIDKQGMDIPRSIARKVTITVLPCNKAAIAEMVPAVAKKPKDDLDNIFKTETGIEIELFKPQAGAELVPMKKAETANPKGIVLGRTNSGKDVFSHGRVGDYTGFGSADHRQAGEMHLDAGRKSGDAKLMAHHQGKSALHLQAAGTSEKRELRGKSPSMSNARINMSTTKQFVDIPGKNRGINKSEDSQKPPQTHEEHEAHINLHSGKVEAAKNKMLASKKVCQKLEKDRVKNPSLHAQADKALEQHNANIDAYTKTADAHHEAIQNHINFIKKTLSIKKAETAGSGNVAPSQLTGMAALAKEDILHDNIASRRKARAEGYKAHGDMKSHAIAVEGIKDAHKQQLADLKAQPKPKLTKALTRDHYGPANTTGHEKGVHTGTEFRETDKTGAGHSDAGEQHRFASKIKDITKDHKGRQLPLKDIVENKKLARDSAAYAKNDHKRVLSELRAQPKPNLTKSQSLLRAEEAYANWEKREQFEQYMAKRMPNLTKGEIKAIGQTLALQKSIAAENTLAKMAGMEKAEKPHGGMNRVGQTRSGKHVYASQKADSKHYKDFSSDDHVDAAAAHHMSQMDGDQKMKQTHWKAKNTHLEASKSSMGPRDLKAHAEKHGVHKPESHDRAEAGSAAAARLSMNSSSKTGFEKSETLEKSFSKVPEKFRGKAPEFKGTIESEVEHVEPHYSSDGPDAVYLKSGHHSHGHKKGKFKVGDKVTAKQHIMGTHILEHKK